MAAAVVPIIATAVGTIASVIGQRKQAKSLEAAAGQQRMAAQEAERIGEMNAASQEAETRETVRRETKAAEEAASLRKAKAAASGGTFGGSTGAFLEEQSERERSYIDWLEKSGASAAQIERERGRLAGMEGRASATLTEGRAGAAKWSALGTLFKGGANIYNMYNPAGLGT